ncbi:NTP transferase domain-containing protein [Hominifimenecus sp. rT4P-3]|uniref:NTP transferase domain-containing protein n=1 Tax=Hominifimenecus sp. rT4P-3 TaxID=3242979 RepID=UPI003DA3FA20
MTTGAIILAAGTCEKMEEFKPMMKLAGTSMIQRQMDTLRQAGVSPIVVVTGYRAEELEKHLAHRGVIFVRNETYETSEMLDSVKLGIEAVIKECDRVLLLPSDTPLFSAETLDAVMRTDAEIAIPVCGGISGHPICLHQKAMEQALAFDGEGGLRGMIHSGALPLKEVSVEDQGVLLEANTKEEYQKLLQFEEQARMEIPLEFRLRLELFKGDSFFGQGTSEFLRRIEKEGSMLKACQEMGMAYSKGWTMIKKAEERLGFCLVERQAGGSRGGNSFLSEEGRDFLQRYEEFVGAVWQEAKRLFSQYFEG